MLMALMPLARTPWGKRDASALQRYVHKIEKSLDASIPWRRASRSRESLRGKVKSGEAVVVLDSGERSDPQLFKDAKVIRES